MNELRERKRMTITDLAKWLAGMTQPEMSSYLTTDRVPRPKTVERFARTLEADPDPAIRAFADRLREARRLDELDKGVRIDAHREAKERARPAAAEPSAPTRDLSALDPQARDSLETLIDLVLRAPWIAAPVLRSAADLLAASQVRPTDSRQQHRA